MPQMDYTPRSWREKNAERLQNAFRIHDIVEDRGAFSVAPDPEFDWARKAEEMMYQTNQVRMQAAAQRAENRNMALAQSPVAFNGGGMPMPKGDFGAFIQAISGKESGGNYGAVNSDSGALGKYQIMPANLAGPGGWDMEAIGRNVTAQQFLNRPKLQEKIARHKLRAYFNQYGPAGAASAWYSGDPNKWKTSKNAQGAYPSIHNYVMAILKAMGR